MSSGEHPPRRLLELSGPAADCLRQVVVEQARDLPPTRFSELRARRQLRVQRQRGLALAVTAVAASICLWATRRHEATPDIRAESSLEHAHRPSAPANSVEPRVASSERNVEIQPSAKREPASPHGVAAHVPAAPSPSTGSAKACAELTRRAGAEPAIACYERLAQGSGVSAELAVFEQARLESKVLHQPERALKRLESYRQRFPRGSLRAEVMLAQIDWLVSSGDSARALQLVNEALQAGIARERTGELERLRERLSSPPP